MTKAILSGWVKREMAQVEAAQARGQVEQTTALRALSARYDGRVRSPAKTQAAKINGAKGGRPGKMTV